MKKLGCLFCLRAIRLLFLYEKLNANFVNNLFHLALFWIVDQVVIEIACVKTISLNCYMRFIQFFDVMQYSRKSFLVPKCLIQYLHCNVNKMCLISSSTIMFVASDLN